jgi:hypothetical protein
VDGLVGLTRLMVVVNFSVRNIFLPFSRQCRHKFQGLRNLSVFYMSHSQSEFAILTKAQTFSFDCWRFVVSLKDLSQISLPVKVN